MHAETTRTSVLARLDVPPWRVPADGLLEYDHQHDEWRVEVHTTGHPRRRVIIRRYAGRRTWGMIAPETSYPSSTHPIMRVFPDMPFVSEKRPDLEPWDRRLRDLPPAPVYLPELDPNYVGEPEHPDFDKAAWLDRYRSMMNDIQTTLARQEHEL